MGTKKQYNLTICHNLKQMEAGKRQTSVFLMSAMENDTLWTYLEIKLIEIDVYDALST